MLEMLLLLIICVLGGYCYILKLESKDIDKLLKENIELREKYNNMVEENLRLHREFNIYLICTTHKMYNITAQKQST